MLPVQRAGDFTAIGRCHTPLEARNRYPLNKVTQFPIGGLNHKAS